MRLQEVSVLKIRLFMEMVQVVSSIITKPLSLVLIIKLLLIWGGTFNASVLFSLSYSVALMNMQAIMNSVTYIEEI